MKISMDNVSIGNRAMASAHLLYYHLLREDGITHDQTVYIDPDDFDGFSFLAINVEANLDIDETFLRDAAVIRLLCDLDDMISEHKNDFWLQPISKRIIGVFNAGSFSAIPETTALFESIAMHKSMDYTQYKTALDHIYRKYVVARFQKLTKGKP